VRCDNHDRSCVSDRHDRNIFPGTFSRYIRFERFRRSTRHIRTHSRSIRSVRRFRHQTTNATIRFIRRVGAAHHNSSHWWAMPTLPQRQRKLCDIKPSSHWPCWEPLPAQAGVRGRSLFRRSDLTISPCGRTLPSRSSQVRAVSGRFSRCPESSLRVKPAIHAAVLVTRATPAGLVERVVRRCNRSTPSAGCEVARWGLRKSIRLVGFSGCRDFCRLDSRGTGRSESCSFDGSTKCRFKIRRILQLMADVRTGEDADSFDVVVELFPGQ
jgi:hypothetical protein